MHPTYAPDTITLLQMLRVTQQCERLQARALAYAHLQSKKSRWRTFAVGLDGQNHRGQLAGVGERKVALDAETDERRDHALVVGWERRYCEMG